MVKTKDLFLLINIYKKLNLKEEMIKLAEDVSGKSEEEIEIIQTKKGGEFFNIIIENLEKVETELYSLLGSYSNISSEEIEAQDLFITLEQLKEMLGDKRLLGFFKSAMQ